MVREAGAAGRIAVALVAVLIDFRAIDEATRQHPDALRIQAMIRDAIDHGEITYDQLLVAVAVLGARAVEGATEASGEATSVWLQRWQGEPFG